MYNIDDLKALAAIIEFNSFSKAASHLLISQPALSRRIAKLEDYIGERLVTRKHKNIELTPIGERFFPIAKNLIIAHFNADSEFKRITLYHT